MCVCGGGHNVLLCYKTDTLHVQPSADAGHQRAVSTSIPPAPAEVSINSDATLTVNKTATNNTKALSVLPTAKVRVKGADDSWHVATLLFDDGSDKSYVSSDLIKPVNPKFVRNANTTFSTFGGSHNSKTKLYSLCTRGVSTDEEWSCDVLDVPVICLPLSNPHVPSELLRKFDNLCLADDFNDREYTKNDILIGQDLFWSLMLGNTYRVDGCDIVAQDSVYV